MTPPVKSPKAKKKGKTPQKPNYSFWIISAVVLFLFSLTMWQRADMVTEVTQRRFEEALLSNDIKQVIIIPNEQSVEFTLKDEALKNDKYKRLLEQGDKVVTKSPRLRFKVISAEAFKDDFEALQKKLPRDKQIGYKVEERVDVFSQFFQYGFLILIFVGFWLLMRRMAGGMGGPGGQIFNIGKSKASLFDADNKVKITFADVAGLSEAKEEVMEVVEFLKKPDKFTKLGGKIPERRAARWPSRNRQNPARQGRSRRSRSTVFYAVRF